MRQNLALEAIFGTIVLLATLNYAFGAAVMSVDLGSEWMKVMCGDIMLYFKVSIKNNFFSSQKCCFIGWHSFSWCTNGYSFK